MVKKILFLESLLDVVYIRSYLIANIVLIKPFIMDMHSLITCVPINTNSFTQIRGSFHRYVALLIVDRIMSIFL